MKFIWNNFEISGIKENEDLIDHLNFLEFTVIRLKKSLNEDIILKNVENFIDFIYEDGKISIHENKIYTNVKGFEKLPESLKEMLLPYYSLKNNLVIFDINLEEVFYIKLKYDNYIIENIIDGNEIIINNILT